MRQERIKRVSVTCRMLAEMWQERIKRASVSFGMLARMRQERMKTASVSFGVLAGVWQEHIKRASVSFRMLARMRQEHFREPWNADNDASGAHEDSLGEPRSVGRSVAGACQESLGDHQNAATAEGLRPARAAAGRAHSSSRAARICGCCSNCTLASYLRGSRKPKKPFPDLGPLQLVDLARKPKQTDAEGAAQKLMQLAMSDTGSLVNLGTALTSRFQILARFRHQNLEPRKRLHDYFPNLNTKPGPQF